MATRKETEKEARLVQNKIIINSWLEKKIYEIPYESFLRIRYSLVRKCDYGLTKSEEFIRNFACSYKNVYGRWPDVFRV